MIATSTCDLFGRNIPAGASGKAISDALFEDQCPAQTVAFSQQPSYILQSGISQFTDIVTDGAIAVSAVRAPSATISIRRATIRSIAVLWISFNMFAIKVVRTTRMSRANEGHARFRL